MAPSSRSRPRALRIGVVLGDTVIAEHLLVGGSFSLGRKAANTVALPVPELPARWELLTIDGRGMRLCLAPGMDVRLSDGPRIKTRADLAVEAGGAGAGAGDVAGDGPLVIALPAGGRGKVVIGEVKVMFHDVEQAPAQPRPRLPPELRATLADRVDRRVLVFAAASLALHVGVMAAARLNDPPAHLTQAERAMAGYVPETVVIDADDLPPLPPLDDGPATPDVKQPPAPAAAPPPVAPVVGDARDGRVDRPRTPRSPGPPAAPVDHAADAARAADALFSDTPGGVGDPTARRRPSGALAQQLDEARDRDARAAIGGGSDRELPRSDGPRLGTIDEPRGPEVGDVRRNDPPPSRPDTGRIVLTPPKKPPPGEPSVDAIVAKIRTTYMPGLVRCYKRAMASTGPMAGKVTLSFEVNTRGTVAAGSATGVDDGLEQCVEGLMAGWRFTPVVDGDGDPTEVDVKLALQLRPD